MAAIENRSRKAIAEEQAKRLPARRAGLEHQHVRWQVWLVLALLVAYGLALLVLAILFVIDPNRFL